MCFFKRTSKYLVWQIMLWIFLHCYIRKQDSVVFIQTGLHADGSGVRIPVRKREFLLLQNVHTGSGAHPDSYWTGNGVPFSEKYGGAGTSCWLLTSWAEIKNEWSYTSMSPVSLHGVDTDFNFVFTFLYRSLECWMLCSKHNKNLRV